MQTIDIRRIQALSPFVDEYALGADFILGSVSGSQVEKHQPIMDMLRYPVRFGGYIIFFMRKGHCKLDLNLNTFDVRENTLLIVVPGNIVKLSYYNEERIADAQLFFALISKDFMSGIRLDFNKVYQDSIRMWDNPCIVLQEEDLSLADDFFNLSRKVLLSKRENRREIMGSLLTSFAYFAMGVWTQRMDREREPDSRSSARVNQLFERFIALVTE